MFDCVFIILFLKLLIHLFRNSGIIRIGRIECFLFGKHMEKAGQNHVRNGYDCPFVSTTFFDTIIFVFEIGVFLIIDGGIGALNQQRL